MNPTVDSMPDQTQDILSSSVSPTPSGDFELLFQMLDELGPVPEGYMQYTQDPVLSREPEDIFAEEEAD